MAKPINQSIQSVNANSWLIGVTELAPDDPHIVLCHDVANASAVWTIGSNTFCKVKRLVEGVTSERQTLDFVDKIVDRKFTAPKVIYSVQIEDRSICIIRRLPGRTLAEAWPTLDSYWRQKYVDAIAGICNYLATLKHDRLVGVDGKRLPEYFLANGEQPEDFDPEKLSKTCQGMGMNCSEFVFYHADLGPTNIIVETKPQHGTIGIIDWENAGFFPKGWVRTKFRLCMGMDLSGDVEDPSEWRSMVQQSLGKIGFEDYAIAWFEWLKIRMQSTCR
ncbi:hypothetical protein L228DRAFT_281148 [Xylona heveae TC161]|uniref:Aminoglycoside phosphotransferase domain-containing protein n=1 Tax=Xylona heveae (strain CBS 132557 / TC161) TaxID=1328760 RepID=A0A165HWT1_XYLHT|nr:hypothetical protein L228DRAFT_281148 [Xylona heveae TC161]KZF24034.1 hypothetical protein L228DRAFT_281148 [Xylona heveae TC161]